MNNHFAVFARIENRDHLLRVFYFTTASGALPPDRARALLKAREFAASQAPADVSIEDAYGALTPLTDTMTTTVTDTMTDTMTDTRRHKWSARTAEVLATEGALLRVRWTDDSREISLPASDFYGPPRTCANCAHNGAPTAPCGLCVGPTAAITRWQPMRVLQQNNDAK